MIPQLTAKEEKLLGNQIEIGKYVDEIINNLSRKYKRPPKGTEFLLFVLSKICSYNELIRLLKTQLEQDIPKLIRKHLELNANGKVVQEVDELLNKLMMQNGSTNMVVDSKLSDICAPIFKDVLGVSRKKARRNRDLLNKHRVLTINVMSSPGDGKTSLILQTIKKLKPETRVAVIEGDVASQFDADKVHQHGVPVIQVNIPGGCHLDSNMIEKALDNLLLEEVDLILIENVGNLICPAEFDLGEHKKAILLSLPEGCATAIQYQGTYISG